MHFIFDLEAIASVRITWKPQCAGPPHLFSLPHRAHAVAENLGIEGSRTYCSAIRLLAIATGGFLYFYLCLTVCVPFVQSDAIIIIISGSSSAS